VGHLNQQPGAITGVRFRASGAAMLQISQRDQGFRHDVVILAAGQICDERDATGVVLELLVVQTLGLMAGHSSGPPRDQMGLVPHVVVRRVAAVSRIAGQ
jgi:hypothetical protein